MPAQEIGVAERTEEIDWRHVWLKSVLIDAGNPFTTKIYRPRPTKRMSATRRLEKLHRMRGWQASLTRSGWFECRSQSDMRRARRDHGPQR